LKKVDKIAMFWVPFQQYWSDGSRLVFSIYSCFFS